jgi:hypothetical protein
LKAIRGLTTDEDAYVRGAAWFSLAHSRDKGLVDVFLSAAERETADVQYWVILGLGMLRSPEAVAYIRRRIADENPALSAAAVDALGFYSGGKEDIEILLQQLESPDRQYQIPGTGNRWSLHELVLTSLHLLTGASPGETPHKWREWWEANRSTFDYDAVVLQALADPVRRAWARRRIWDRHMAHLLEGVWDVIPDREWPYDDLALIARFGDVKASLRLAELLDHPAASMRAFAIRELARAWGVSFLDDKAAWVDWLGDVGEGAD